VPSRICCLRVFIASPGGLTDERRAFRDTIQEFNDADGMARQVIFQAVGWEDTLGGIGRPQSIINEDVRSSDYFVLLLWNRWGTRPEKDASRYTSGTEEEFNVALECHKLRTMRQVVIMFKAVDPEQLSDPGPQLRSVLDFRERIERDKEHLFHTFDTLESFRKLIHRYLASWLRDEEMGTGDVPSPLVPPAPGPGVYLGEFAEDSITRESPLVENAWRLAEEGRLAEAEVEFSRSVVGSSSPAPLVAYGRFLHRLGRLDQARVLLEGAIKIARESKDQAGLALAYGRLGVVFRVRGDLAAAEEMCRKSLEIEERLGRLEGMANQYGSLGSVLRTRGDLAAAEEMYRKSLAISEQLGRLEGMAGQYGNLGIVFHERGDLAAAEEMYRKSLEIEERLGRLEGMARQYGNLGIVSRVRGDLTAAEVMYRKSLEINEKLGRLVDMASDYGDLGVVFQARGDLAAAEEMYRKSLEIAKRLGTTPLVAHVEDLMRTLKHAPRPKKSKREMGCRPTRGST